MKRFLFIAFFFLGVFASAPVASAQVYDTTCPGGSSVAPYGEARNPTNDHLKQNYCLDSTGSPIVNGPETIIGPCTGSGCGQPVPGITGPPTNGLIGRFEIPSTDSVAALTDSSGNGNNGIGTVGTFPPVIGALGGLVCNNGGGASILPAALNSATTIALYMKVGASGVGTYNSSPLGGNGNGTTSGAIQFLLTNQTIIGSDNNVNLWQLTGNNVARTDSLTGFMGTGAAIIELGTLDHIYLNGNESTYRVQGTTAGFQTVGNYQLCGAAFGSGGSNQTYARNTTIYKAYFYNRLLTRAEIDQLTNYWNTLGPTYGAPFTPFSPNAPSVQVVGEGDSLMDGDSGCTQTCYFPLMTLFNASYTAVNHGVPALAALDVQANPIYTYGNYCNPAAQDNLSFFVLGSNDIANHAKTTAQTFSLIGQAIHYWTNVCPGGRVILGTMIDRSTNVASLQALTASLYGNWRAMGAVGLADFASDTQLGCNGCNLNNTYFFDNIHPNQNGATNDETFIAQRAINSAIGNLDWNTAATYTTGAAAAVATTAVTESANTVTVTFAATPANCQKGNLIALTGVTPSTYNSTTTNGAGLSGWMILTSTATTITYYNNTTGIANATVQGTGVCAQAQDQDVFAILGGSAASPNHSLEPCEGYSGQSLYRMVTNTNASPWTISGWGSETINGGATFTTPVASATNHPVVELKAIPGAIGTGGCTWQASLK